MGDSISSLTNPTPDSPQSQNPVPNHPQIDDKNPKSNQATEASPQKVQEQGGDEIEGGDEVEEEEEEGEGECGFCVYMKGGGCKESFTDWENCIQQAETENEDLVSKCHEVTRILHLCMEAHYDYYAPLLKAEKEAEEMIAKDLEREKEETKEKGEQEKMVVRNVEEAVVVEVVGVEKGMMERGGSEQRGEGSESLNDQEVILEENVVG